MYKFLIVIIGLFISSNLIADDFTVEHKKEAEKFIIIMNYKESGETMKKNMEANYGKNLSALLPPQIPNVDNSKVKKIFSDYKTAIIKTVGKVFDWEIMKPLYIRGVASTYTKDELAKLNSFFVRPEAKIFLSKQQILVNNMMNIGNELSGSLLLPELEKLKLEMVKGIKSLQTEAVKK